MCRRREPCATTLSRAVIEHCIESVYKLWSIARRTERCRLSLLCRTIERRWATRYLTSAMPPPSIQTLPIPRLFLSFSRFKHIYHSFIIRKSFSPRLSCPRVASLSFASPPATSVSRRVPLFSNFARIPRLRTFLAAELSFHDASLTASHRRWKLVPRHGRIRGD